MTFNILTATGLELDAVLGQIKVPMTFYNLVDGNQQCIEQVFLVLRENHTLAIPLLGTDFMRVNRGELKFQPSGPVQLLLNGIHVDPKPQIIPIQFFSVKN